MAMTEDSYIIFNETEIPKIGSGVRKIYVKESKRYAYIKDKYDNKVRMKLPIWENYKKTRFKINETCLTGEHNNCKCVTSYTTKDINN